MNSENLISQVKKEKYNDAIWEGQTAYESLRDTALKLLCSAYNSQVYNVAYRLEMPVRQNIFASLCICLFNYWSVLHCERSEFEKENEAWELTAYQLRVLIWAYHYLTPDEQEIIKTRYPFVKKLAVRLLDLENQIIK